ncbi:Hypothetical predicted protein [Podarcis lilfordi]|uniref:Uncharacterized protein n=1 Tax=Podarcis lilfordi TaxID=74358 RepID=A0AA35LH41_9SAUR|nr:Hypothetical predicted protein [Podarcis lilfordi]
MPHRRIASNEDGVRGFTRHGRDSLPEESRRQLDQAGVSVATGRNPGEHPAPLL